MPKAYQEFSAATGLSRLQERQRIGNVVLRQGTAQIPKPPRDLCFQPGSRGGLLTWKLPSDDTAVAHWRVYKNTENELLEEIADKGTRQKYVDLSSGDIPPVINLFVSSVSASGKESSKVQIKARSTVEAGAPNVPSAPVGFITENSGGGDKGSFGQPRDF